MFKLNQFYCIMNIARIREKIRNAGYFIPVRMHLILLLISLFLAEGWIQKNNAVPQTARTAILNLFIVVTFWFAFGILLFSFLSVFVPWIIFLLDRKNNRTSLMLRTPAKDMVNRQQINVDISRITRPPFGYIRLRLLYDGNNVSPKFAPIAVQAKKNFFSTHLKGLYNWHLKNIREYDIHNSIIYFEDFFQFFSFTAWLSSAGNFYTQPLQSATGKISAQPKKTEETNTRIEEMRKVDGEFLNYKNFEHHDDVRRIVWKIYAKNKELVVRIPETNDPYASHIYFYASFYNAISSELYHEFNEVFLDNFKTIVWNTYEQLYRQNELIDYIPDQETKTFYADDPAQKVKYIISTSAWHKQNDLRSYFNRQYGSVLCISSLTGTQQLTEILEKAGTSLNIIFVPLSKSFANVHAIDWLQWIFIKPEKKSSDKMQIAFNLSPLRRKLLENEKNIKGILKKSECEVLVLDSGQQSNT